MNVKRKILFVNSSVSGGGAGKALIYMLRALNKEHVEAHVILPFDGVVGEEIKKTGAIVHYVPWLPERFSKTQFQLPKYMRRKWLQSFSNILLMFYFALSVAKIARRQKVDIICSNHQFHIPICITAGYLSGKPVILYSREFVEGFRGTYFFRHAAQLNIVKRIFSISRVAGRLYKDMDKLKLLPDSYDFKSFGGQMPQPQLRKQFNLSDDLFIFGFMGRIIQRKGADFLIKAFAKVHQKYPQTHLAIVGGNDPGISYDLLSEYKNLAKSLGIEKNVTFTGFQKDVRVMAGDFNVCVMPSLNPEPFGLVYVESVICRIPCIVPDNSGAGEIVIHHENGYLFNAMDVDSLAACMMEVFENQKDFGTLTENAYRIAYEAFDIEQRSKEITDSFLAVAN